MNNKISYPKNQLFMEDEFPLGLCDNGSEYLPRDIIYLLTDEYKVMQQHDPSTVYVLIDDKHHSIYRGDERIAIYENKPVHQYVLTYDQDHETYMMMLRFGHMNHEMLIPIAEYKDPQVAMNMLTRLNTLGFDPNDVKSVISSFREGTINAFSAIIGIFKIFGFNPNDPRIQEIISLGNKYCLWNKDNQLIPNRLIDEMQINLDNPRKNKNYIMKYFIDIYLIFYRYKYFKAEEFDNNESLNIPLKEIYAIFR